jgi:uncharacterized protein YcbK (DUF882 family)
MKEVFYASRETRRFSLGIPLRVLCAAVVKKALTSAAARQLLARRAPSTQLRSMACQSVTRRRATLRRRDLLLATGVCILLRNTAFARPSVGRRLNLKNAHTGETFDGPYRDAAGPLPSAVSDLAVFLRDFHVDQSGPVDIGMLDFLADVMTATNQSGATVLSAFRTRETNERLRATTFGVAEQSMHLFGRAIDVTFDRRLGGAMQAALAMKRGGVGWYPRSYFIHLDSGPTRNWELDGDDLDRLLAGGSSSQDLLGPPRPGHVMTVKERLARGRALARQEFLLRGGR